MIIHGSVNFTTSGRKRNTTKSRSTKMTGSVTPRQPYRRETKHYPSLSTGVGVAPLVDNSEKIKQSANFTIAPAYNKGAYQVITRDCVQHIGRS